MSLQKPKKIVIRGSDGKEYTMMCKPKVSIDVHINLTLFEYSNRNFGGSFKFVISVTRMIYVKIAVSWNSIHLSIR